MRVVHIVGQTASVGASSTRPLLMHDIGTVHCTLGYKDIQIFVPQRLHFYETSAQYLQNKISRKI